MNELKLRISILCALAAVMAAGTANAAINGTRPGAPQAEDIYSELLQGSGVDEQTVRDMTIQSSIEIKYFDEPKLNAAKIHVQVKDADVHLTGAVATGADKSLAGKLAREVNHVDDVTNDIQVNPDAANS
jgi:osmotically-inducible protein OsmY